MLDGRKKITHYAFAAHAGACAAKRREHSMQRARIRARGIISL